MNLDMINNLPNDIIDYIFTLLSPKSKIFLTKSFYNKYNNYIDKIINDSKIESYIRDIVRKDYIFSFKTIFYRNLSHWMLMTNYPYSKNIVFENYLTFLKYYAEKNSSLKCLNFINKHYKSDNLKSHKYKFSKNIKWTN
tara:strand:+ start:22465 stop:22881 length:417 start_codon:yes stop_codon:yes gene_type:complete